jgi:exopolyphosphatase/guanosine-5'-triphosphate,3'-diphosphate pyrophosphatase
MTDEERKNIPCIGEGREDLVMAGSAIFEGLATALAIPKLKIADRGVREGILSELLTEIARH